ncbi:MAG TPA: hypothetical protein VN776_02290 [Terracidiphilus sp.]|nr:hypothetical protein [Terracidiphilus sp.]
MADAHELAKVYYAAARAEVLQRLALREQVLLAGVTAFGVTSGLALSNRMQNVNLFSLFPLLSFAFTAVLFRHEYVMHNLGTYIAVELDPSLGIKEEKGTGESAMPVHYDAWLSLPHQGQIPPPGRKHKAVAAVDLFGAWLLLWGPGLGGFILVFHQARPVIVWTDSVLLSLAIAPYLRGTYYALSRWRLTRSEKGTRRTRPRNS